MSTCPRIKEPIIYLIAERHLKNIKSGNINKQADPYKALLLGIAGVYSTSIYSAIADPNSIQPGDNVGEVVQIINKVIEAQGMVQNIVLDGLRNAAVALQNSLNIANINKSVEEEVEVIETNSITMDATNESDLEGTESPIDYEVANRKKFQVTPGTKAKVLSELYEVYLPGKLLGRANVVINLFKKLIANNWMPTAENKDAGANFDFKVVKNSIKKDAIENITNYYTSIADGILSYSKGTALNEALVFTNQARIPADARIFYTDKETGVVFYRSKFVNSLIVVLPFDAELSNNLNLTDVLKRALRSTPKYPINQESDIVISNIASLEESAKPPRIDLESISANMDNDRMFNTYASIILLNEFDLLTDSELKMLSASYREEYRDGPDEMSKAGSNMATKFIKLAIVSTPLIHSNYNTSDITRQITKLSDDIVNDNSSGVERLKKANLLRLIDADGNTMFHYDEDGNTVFNVQANLGSADVIFSYDAINKAWYVQTESGVPGQYIKVFNAYSVGKNSNLHISDIVQTNIYNILRVLNASVEKFPKSVDWNGNNRGKSMVMEVNSLSNIASNNNIPIIQPFSDSTRDKFLDIKDLSTAAHKLHAIPTELGSAGDALLKMSMETGAYANVARALYYKFFHLGGYKIRELDPITGVFTTKSHISIYEKYLNTGDQALKDSLVAVISEIHSTMKDDKVFIDNGYMVQTHVAESNNIDFMIKNINTVGMTSVRGAMTLVDDTNISKRFKVEVHNGVTTLHWYQYSDRTAAKPTASFVLDANDNVRIIGTEENYSIIPFTFINTMLSQLKFPSKFNDANLYEAIKRTFNNVNGLTINEAINQFYIKTILMRLAHTVNNVNHAPVAAYENISLTPSPSKEFKYRFEENLNDFKPALERAIGEVFSKTYSPIVAGPTGDEYSTSKYHTLSARKKEYINELIRQADIPSLLAESGFIKNRTMRITDALTRLGIKVGIDSKNVGDLTKQELTTFLINTFIQHAINTKFKEGLTVEDTQADRSTITAHAVKLTRDHDSLAPITKNGTLDEETLKRKFFDTQTRSFSAMQNTLITQWKNTLNGINAGAIKLSNPIIIEQADIDNLTSIRSIYNLLQKYKLPFSDILYNTKLVKGFSFIKGAKDPITGKPIASLNYALVQLSDIVLADVPVEGQIYKDAEEQSKLSRNLAIKRFYLSMYYNEFMNHTRSAEYQISSKEVNGITSMFPALDALSQKEKTAAAKDIALKIFFYNDAIFQQELIQFGMGNVFQYESKVDSIFETMQDEAILSDEEILKRIENYDFGDGITTNMDFIELQARGDKANAASSIKSILISNLPISDKVAILKYLDIFAQISPMQVTRVKRNHGSGTCGLGPVLAALNEAGILLGQEEKTLLVEDPEKPITPLNSSSENIEALNGSQWITPAYAYKLNYSLGNRFSNFRSTAMFKTVNPAKSSEGIAVFEKLAAFSNFTWEIMMNASAEHHSLHQAMMEKEKFDEQPNSGYDGLYLLNKEYIRNPKAARFINKLNGNTIEEQIQELLKHGPYLGELLVNIKGEMRPRKINSFVLMNDLTRGKIRPEDITSIYTNKEFIGKDKINSKLDLYNYYGGISGNIAMHKTYRDLGKEKEFLDEFPFGWVEYQLVNIMCNYAGVNKNYPIRNAEINKVEFVSAVKTGQHGVNPVSVLRSKTIDLTSLNVTNISNRFLNVVLNPIHNSDTTADKEFSDSKVEESTLALFTQVIGNVNAEGNSSDIVANINDILSKISEAELKAINNEMMSYAEEAKERGMTPERFFLIELSTKAAKQRDGNDTLLKLLAKPEAVSFDLRLLYPIMRTSINAEYKRRGISMRLPGGQFVLAPHEGMIQLYNYNGSQNLTRTTINPVKKENGEEVYNSINGVLKEEITSPNFKGNLKDKKWKLSPVTDLQTLRDEHNALDFVYKVTTRPVIENGVSVMKPQYTAILVEDILLSPDKFLDSEFVSPWIGFNKADASDLNFMNWIKDGKSLYESDEWHSTFLAGTAPAKLVEISKDTDAKLSVVQNTYDAKTLELTTAASTLKKGTKAYKAIEEELLRQKEEQVRLEQSILFSEKRQKLEYIAATMKVPGAVPKLLWARYILELKNTTSDEVLLAAIATIDIAPELYFSKILGEKSIDSAYAAFEAELESIKYKSLSATGEVISQSAVNTPLIDGFLYFLESYNGKEKPLVNMAKTQMKMSLDQGHWISKPGEFILPPPHKAAQLIKWGDQIADIVGIQEQPDLEKMASMAKLKDYEISLLSRNYINEPSMSNLKSKLLSIAESGGPEVKAEILKYINLSEQRYNHSLNYFEGRVRAISTSITDSAKDRKILLKHAPLLLLKYYKDKGANNLVSETVDILLKSNDVSSNIELFNSLLELKQQIEAKEDVSSKIDTLAQNFKTNWATQLTIGFPHSLTFLTARIPHSAYQQTATGKIVAFIHSAENSIYSPVEMLAISGADFDVDKQNNVHWHLNSNGGILAWDHLIGSDGLFTLDDAIIQINKSAEALKETLNALEWPNKQITRAVNNFKKSAMLNLKNTAQNFLLSELIKIVGSSKNATMLSTSILMKKLGVLKNYMAAFNFSKLDIDKYNLTYKEVKDPITGLVTYDVELSQEVLDLIEKRNMANPFSPHTKMLYERVTLEGKSGISIFASATKAYMTIFGAMATNEESNAFDKELSTILSMIDKNTEINLEDIHAVAKDRVKEKKVKSLKYLEFNKAKNTATKEVGTEFIKVVWKDPLTGLLHSSKELRYPANSEKFVSSISDKETTRYPQLHSVAAKKAYADLMFATSPQAEAEIILKYKESLDAKSEFLMEPQAWNDFSELMSAATDNAKELILSAIGATKTTNKYIVSMLAMGVPLEGILLIINDPIIKEIVKVHDAESSLLKVKDKATSFKDKLSARINKFKQNLTREEIEETVARNYPTYSAEQIEEEVQNQIALYKNYNPAKQLFIISKAADEFSTLTGILSINTNAPNTDMDVMNYFLKLDKIFTIREKVGDIYKTYTLKDFLTGNEETVNKIIELANSYKMAFNIPFLIYNNKPLFQYIKTLYSSNDVAKNQSYTAQIMDEVIRPKLVEVNKLYLTKKDLYTISDMLSNLALSTYYQKDKRKRDLYFPSLNLRFDLGTTEGRDSFIRQMPTIKNQLISNNQELDNLEILKTLNASDIRTDKVSGKSIILFEGINTRFISDSEMAIFKLELQNLKTLSSELYAALMNYSLIVDKGGLSRSSIANLIGFEVIEDFNKHLLHLHKSGEMESLVKSIPLDKLCILIPSLSRQVSTLKNVQNTRKFKKKIATNDQDFEDSFLVQEEESGLTEVVFEDENIEDIETEKRMQYAENIHNKYNVHDINELMMISLGQEKYVIIDEKGIVKENKGEITIALKNTKNLTVGDKLYVSINNKNVKVEIIEIGENKVKVKELDGTILAGTYPVSMLNDSNIQVDKTVTSLTNGLTYHYFEFKVHPNYKYAFNNQDTIKTFVPILRDYDPIIGNIDVMENMSKVDVASLSYAPGWEIALSDGTKARLLGHISMVFKGMPFNDARYIILKNNKIETIDKFQIEEFNQNIDLVGNSIKLSKGRITPSKSFSIQWDESKRIHLNMPFSSKLLLGNHVKVKKDNDVVSDVLKINDVLSIPADINDLSSIEAVKEGRLNKSVIKLFAGVLTSLNISNVTEQSVTANTYYNEQINGLTATNSSKGTPEFTAIYEFVHSLLLPANYKKLYLFLRQSDGEKLKFINTEVLEGLMKVETLRPLDIDHDESLHAIKLLESKEAIKADYELANDQNLTFKEYMTILNKFGITPKDYMNILGEKDGVALNNLNGRLQLLVIDNKAYPAKNYERFNAELKNIKYSIPLDINPSETKRKENVRKVSRKMVNKLSLFLNKRFPESTIKMMTPAEIKLEYPNYDLENTEDAFVNVGDNTIVLVEGRVTMETVLHEMGHLYLAELKAKDLGLYQEIMQKLVNDPLFKEISEKYVNKKSYNVADLLEEVFVTKLQKVYGAQYTNLLDLESQEMFDGALAKGDSQIGMITETMASIFGDFFGAKVQGEIKITDSIEDIIHKVGIDVIFNKNSSLNNMNRNDVNNLKTLLKNKQMTEAQAELTLIESKRLVKNCS